MTRMISVLAFTLLTAGLTAQTLAAELPTRANFIDEDASQQDVQRVLGDLGFGNVKILARRGRVFDVIANWEGRISVSTAARAMAPAGVPSRTRQARALSSQIES